MTELEQIRALASQGVGRLNAEAMIGRHMTPDIEISCRCRMPPPVANAHDGRKHGFSGRRRFVFMVRAEKVSVYTNCFEAR